MMPPGLEAKHGTRPDPELKQWLEAFRVKLFGDQP